MTSPLIPIKIAAGSEGGIVNGEVTEGSAGEDYTMGPFSYIVTNNCLRVLVYSAVLSWVWSLVTLSQTRSKRNRPATPAPLDPLPTIRTSRRASVLAALKAGRREARKAG
jgi:hypothetical protein